MFYRKQIRELEDQLGISKEDGKKMRRELFWALPGIVVKSFFEGLEDFHRERRGFTPGATILHIPGITSGGNLYSPSFDPEAFSIAVRHTLGEIPEESESIPIEDNQATTINTAEE